MRIYVIVFYDQNGVHSVFAGDSQHTARRHAAEEILDLVPAPGDPNRPAYTLEADDTVRERVAGLLKDGNIDRAYQTFVEWSGANLWEDVVEFLEAQ